MEIATPDPQLARLRKQLAVLEAKPRLRLTQREQLARLCAATGRAEDARRTFAEVAREKVDIKPPDFTPVGFDLGVGNLWRLAGDAERADDSLQRARRELASEARDSDQRKPPYLFTLLLLGHDQALIEEATSFGEAACGERAWAAMQAVRAGVEGVSAEIEQWLAEWRRRAASEKVATDGLHPSDRDISELLDRRFGGAVGRAEPPGPTPSMTVDLDDTIDADVIGWWGHYVVLVRDDRVMLYDTAAGSVAYDVVAQRTDGLAWNPAGACFAAGLIAYVLTLSPTGVSAVALRPGGPCRFGAGGSLLAVERGFAATVFHASGLDVVTGRAPAAVTPDASAIAITTDEGTTRVVMLGASGGPTGSTDVHTVASALAWFPAGDRLACAEDAGQTVRIVAVPSGEIVDEAVLHEDEPIVAVAVAPHGTSYASVGFDGVLGVRDVEGGHSSSHFVGERLDDVAWDAAGELIAVLSERGWFVMTPAGERLDVAHASSLAWHPVNRRVASVTDGHLIVRSY